jgi:hypothetical protein
VSVKKLQNKSRKGHLKVLALAPSWEDPRFGCLPEPLRCQEEGETMPLPGLWSGEGSRVKGTPLGLELGGRFLSTGKSP